VVGSLQGYDIHRSLRRLQNKAGMLVTMLQAAGFVRILP
jgi:hypothetical protein